MRLRSFLVIIMSIVLLGIADHAEAQRNKYKARRKMNRKIGKYQGGVRGYGRFEPYIFLGGQVNAGNYFGDLAPVNRNASTDISFTRPGVGFLAGYKFHHSFAVTAELNWVRVYGDDFASDPDSESDFSRYARNLSFRNDIKELRANLLVYLFPNYGGPRTRLPFNAYLSVGVAVFHHEPMGKVPDADYQSALDGSVAAPQAGEWVKLRPLGTEGQNLGITDSYSNIALSIPVSVGAQMRIPNTQLTAGIEFGIRYLFTDYIDDVSTNYVGLDQFGDDDLARIMSDRSTVPLSSQGDARDISRLNRTANGNGFFTIPGYGTQDQQRGGPDNNDMIFVTQLKVSYVLGSKTRRRAKYR